MSRSCTADRPSRRGPASAPSANRLGGETSPYLLQHKDNPVHWQPWGPDAFALAARTGKPILLSVGYAACHWCHVMAHESFEDEATASVMNDLFVNIKVDREERPDVDAVYQQALALLGEPGGWPLTMFLTPKGEPIWGGTYFPPEPRFGRPGFRDVLRRVAEIYRDQPDAVRQNVDTLVRALKTLSTSRRGGTLARADMDRVAERLLTHVDPVHGGLSGAPKFPNTQVFELLWRAYRRTGREAYRRAVCATLDHMCQGGIYDHVGGGFARYAVDAAWLVPHFEKMLYDNAQLVELLTLVWQHTRSPLYATRVDETLTWTLREMTVEGGGFAGTLDADSADEEGHAEEGRFYVWDAAEIDALLGADAPAFKAAYGVTPAGNWEGKTILNRSRHMEPGDESEESRLAACRRILFEARERRPRPARDDKVLADWNGLMIAALVRAAQAFDRSPWLQAARRAFAFVSEHLGRDERLYHTWCAGRAAHPGTLDDYAAMSRAALALFEATGEEAYLGRARAWLEHVDRHFRDPDDGGYFFSADEVDDLITRTKTAFDHATPAGNALLAEVLARLHYLTGENAHGERAETLIAVFAGEVERNPLAVATLVNAAELLAEGVQIVICGDPEDAATRALVRAAHGVSLPNRVQQVLAPDRTLPPGHPAHGKTATGQRAAAYVCRGRVCSLPLTDPAALADALHTG